MAINFPNSPSTNDIHVSGANRWQWNGSSWTRIGGVNSDADAINSTNDNSTTTLYPVMVTGTGTQTAKVATSATKNISFDASEGNLTVGGNISVGGTITYEDVTNIDSIGIITARAGVIVTGNLDTDTLYVSGIATNIGGINVGTAGTISSAGNLTFDKPGAGIITATKFVGSGAELTGVISGVGIQSGGAVIGSGVTTLNFIGVGNTFKYTQGTDTVDVSISASAVSISETAPSSPNDGDLWWDSDNGNLHIYYEDGNSNQWITASSSGPQGPQGAQGVQGAQGHQGRQGSVGIASLTISTGVPGSPAQGDMWWDSDDGDLHLYYNDGNSSQWININAGSAGAQGVQGATGSTGAGGAQGAQGHQGVQGAAGAQGAQGRQGAAGSTTTINNNANNRVITGSGTANTLEAESDFTWDDSAKRLVVGSQIVRIGDSAGSNSGSRSTTVGNSAGNNSGSYSVNIGNNTGSGSGSYSVNVGANSVGGNAGSYSVNIGGNAVGYSNPATGSINIGSQYAGYSNAGEHCINIGYAAGYQSGGKYGVNIGYNAGNMHLVSSSHNVAIGYEALKNEGANKYCIGIGASCYLPIKGEATGASDNQLVIGVGHTAWIVGTKNYNIGLGVTNPTNALDVQGGTTNTAIVARSTDAKAQISLLDNSTSSVGSVCIGAEGNELFLTSGSGGGERLRIDSSGRVLIGGGSSPTQVGDAQLLVYSSDRKHPSIKCAGLSNNQANGYNMLGDNYLADESQVNIGVSYSSSSLVLSRCCKVSDTADNTYLSSQDSYNAKPTALVLDGDGALRFHTTETHATVATDSAVTLTEVFNIDRVGNIRQKITGRYMYFGASQALKIGVNGSDPLIDAVSGDLSIKNTDSTIAIVRSDHLQMYTDIKMNSGKGIDFSATGNSNHITDNEVLNDYERGQWSPGFLFGGGSTGWSWSSEGHYEKVGQVVTCIGFLDFTAKGSSTGEAKVTGLPYTVGDILSNTSQEGAGWFTYFGNMNTSNYSHYDFWVQGGTTNCSVQRHNNAASVSTANDGDFASNTQLRIYVRYFVNPI